MTRTPLRKENSGIRDHQVQPSQGHRPGPAGFTEARAIPLPHRIIGPRRMTNMSVLIDSRGR